LHFLKRKINMELSLQILPYDLSICHAPPHADLPLLSIESAFLSVTKTPEELSVICESQCVPKGLKCESGWAAIRIVGPLDLSLIGILADLSSLLAEADISIFAISTYETDILLIKSEMLPEARKVLETRHTILGG